MFDHCLFNIISVLTPTSNPYCSQPPEVGAYVLLLCDHIVQYLPRK